MLAIQNPVKAIANDALTSLHSLTSLPVMLDRLEDIDVIALDAAVSSGLMGERARRLLANRQRVLPNILPRLLITTHNEIEREQVQQAASHLQPFAESVTVLDERGRNETAVNALELHRLY